MLKTGDEYKPSRMLVKELEFDTAFYTRNNVKDVYKVCSNVVNLISTGRSRR